MELSIFLSILALLCLCGMFSDGEIGKRCNVSFVFMVAILVGWEIVQLVIV